MSVLALVNDVDRLLLVGGVDGLLLYDHFFDLADPLGVTDLLTAGVGVSVLFGDPINLADSASAALDLASEPSDPLGVTDAASQESQTARTAADALVITDQTTTASGHAREPADAFGLADSAGIAADFAREAADPTGLSDSASTAAGFAVELADPLGLADVLEQAAQTARSQADPLGVTDVATTAAAFAAALADPLRLRDVWNADEDFIFPGPTRLLADDEGLSDSTAVSAPLLSDVADVETLTDQLTYTLSELLAQRTVTDDEGLSDTATAAVPTPGRLITDGEALADVVSRLQVAFRQITDAEGLVDTSASAPGLQVVFLDAEALGDGLVLAFIYGPHLPFPIVALLLLAPTPSARLEVAPAPSARLVVAGPPSARVTLDPSMHVLPLNDRLAIKRGDDARLLIRDAADENGDPFNWALSPGIQVTWTLRRQPADSTFLARRTNAAGDGIVLGAPGEGTITLDGDGSAGEVSHTSIAGNHWWDLQIRTTSEDVHTLTTGELIIEDDVSRP